MYNVDKLEQQWIRYRRKRMIYPLIFAILGISVLAVGIYFIGSDRNLQESNKSIAINENNNIEISSEMRKKVTTQKPLSAKLDILSTEVPSLSTDKSNDQPKVGQIIFEDMQKSSKPKVKKRKNLLIQVTERGGKDIAEDIENRFEFAKDKSDSLFLAKYYYDKMEFSKAEKWALETNKLDNSIEESWLIFAKSLAKQGKRIEALKVLKAYIDQSESVNAKRLMDKIRRGKSF